MPLTRAAVELEVCNLIGRLMTLAGLPGATTDGTNPALNAPIRDGLTRMGYGLADPSGLVVADVDLAGLNPLALRRLLEWAELFTLEQVDRDWWQAETNRGKDLQVRIEAGVAVDPVARLGQRVRSRLEQLRSIVKTPYQSMNVPLSVGQIVAGTRLDRTLPPNVLDHISPWRLAPDGVWAYGCGSGDYWGWSGWSEDFT